MSDLSVVVVTYNARVFLPACLSSVARHLSGIAYEVCVVDNASGDGTRALVEKEFPWVVLVANQSNVGFAAGVNRGLERTTGRYVLWLNPDTELLDDGFVEIVRYLDAHPETAVVGPQLVNPRGEIELSCRSFPSYGAAIGHRYSLLTRVFPQNRYTRQYLRTDLDHSRIEDVDWVSGACLLQRREIVDKVGRLDERFFMYCEDVDFCLRVHRQGFKVRYHPGARVLHHIGGSSRHVSRRMVVEHHRSMWRYYAKHFRRNALKDAVVGTAIWTRCAVKAIGATVSG